MSSLRVILTVLIIPSIITTVLANVFEILNPNRLLLGRDANEFDLSRARKKYIDQPLDHFNSSENRTFQMRYFERLDFWKPNGPIYLFFAGFGTVDRFWITHESSLVTQMANETNGALFAPELRYYGASSPDIPQNNLTEYYMYLNLQQQLADLVNLIKFLKSDPKYQSSKVVAVGGGFGANYGVWLRALHPELVDAAIASSEIILAKKDVKEFYADVAHILDKYGGEMCIINAAALFKAFDGFLQTSAGIEMFKIWDHICPESDLTVLENQQFIFREYYLGLIAPPVLFGGPEGVKYICSYLERRGKITEYLNFLKQARSVQSNKHCWHVDFQPHNDPATYQICSEFGFLFTTTSEKEPFVHWNPLEFTLKTCKGVIKEDTEKRIDEGVARTNKLYGGISPNVTKVVFSHGDMDALQALQVPKDLGPDAPVIVVNGTSHGAVLFIYDKEPEELTKHRKHVKELIKKWISTP